MAHLNEISGLAYGSSFPHSNPTKGDHKLRIEDLSCRTLCDISAFYSRSSQLTNDLLEIVYGSEVYAFGGLLSRAPDAIERDFAANPERACRCVKAPDGGSGS